MNKNLLVITTLIVVCMSCCVNAAVLVHEGFASNKANNVTIVGYDGTATSTGLTGAWSLNPAGSPDKEQLKYSGAAWYGIDGGYVPDGVGESYRTFWEKDNAWGNNIAECALSSSIDMTVDGTWYMSFFGKTKLANCVFQMGLNDGANELMFGNGFAGGDATTPKGITAYYGPIDTNPITGANNIEIVPVGTVADTYFFVGRLVKSGSDLTVDIVYYNLTESGTIDSVDPAAWTRSMTLSGVDTVFTHLELKINGANTNYPAIDEVRIGQNWEDVTGIPESTSPVIVTQPQSLVVDAGDPAGFSIDVTNALSFEWYYSSDPVIDGGDLQISSGETYEIAAGQASDEGYYYCVVTNASALVYSDVVSLGVRRKVTCWTLDSSSYSGGQYRDGTGEHPATVTGTPVFVPGVNPTNTHEGVIVDAANGYASAGAFDPAGFTDQMTVLLWFYWDADDDQSHVLVSKRDDVSDYLWRFVITPEERLSFGGNQVAIESEMAITPGQWVFAAATLDGHIAAIHLKPGDSVMMDRAGGPVILGQKSETAFNIGADTVDSALNGVLDNIEVYNYILTDQQIADRLTAVSGQSVCDGLENSVFDVSGPNGNADCVVDFYDFVEFAAAWMDSGIISE